MLDRTQLGIEEVESVLVSTHPGSALTVDERTDDTGTAQQIALAQLISHITEPLERDGLLIDTLLKHTQPEVSAVVLDDGVDLTLLEVDLHTVEGVIQHAVVLGLIDRYTMSVIADDDATKVVAVESGHWFGHRSLDMDEVIALQPEDTSIGGSHVDHAITILTKSGEDEVAAILQEAFHLFPIETDDALTIIDHPQTALLILNHGVDRMKAGQCPTYLSGMSRIVELHHTQSGSACQHIAVLTFQETGGIAAALLSLQVVHRHIIESLTIPSLQRAVHTKIKKPVAILHHGIHVIAGQFLISLILTTEHTELVTIVTVDTITRRRPDESIVIEVHLCDKTTG